MVDNLKKITSLVKTVNCLCEPRVVVTNNIRSLQAQARKFLGLKCVHCHVPCPAEDLLTCDSCWKRENQFSWRMWPLFACPHLREGPTLKNNWAIQIGQDGLDKKKREIRKLGNRKVEVNLKETGETDWYDQNIL